MVIKKDDIPSHRRSKETPRHYTNNTEFHGLYIGIVKNTRDVQYMGRLDVYLPDFGGDEDNYKLWKTVSYVTPFGGSTPAAERHWIKGIDYDHTPTSYGFWAVPPDIGNKVLVMFINGDPARGVWLGCLLDSFMNHSMPGLSSYDKHDLENSDYINVPTTEYNKFDKTLQNPLLPLIRPHHRPSYQRLVEQGLIEDAHRGTTTSSASRDSPSHVYGMSTPGPLDLSAKNVSETYKRIGGHTFVMDDGDPNKNNENELIRLRTRGGSQILLHDTSGFVYICNKDASAWIELDQVGNIEIYSDRHFTIRAQEDINIRADRDLNIDIGRDLNLHMAADYIAPTGMEIDNEGRKSTSSKLTDPIKTAIPDGSIVIELKNGHIHSTLKKGNIETDVAGYVKHKVQKTLHYHIGDNMSYHTENNAFFTSGGEMNVKSGGTYKETAPEIHMNGPDAGTDISIARPVLPELTVHDDVISFSEETGAEIIQHEHRGTRFISREPYQYHKNQLTRTIQPQANSVLEEPIVNDPITGKQIPIGAIDSRAAIPLDKIDKTGIHRGIGFGTQKEPLYEKIADSENIDGDALLYAPSEMTISETGIDLIKEFEGYSSVPYRDATGFSIGYGHFIKEGESFTSINKEIGNKLLMQDLQDSERVVQQAVMQPLSQQQFDSLTSLVYNIGGSAFRQSTLLKELNAGNIEKVPSEMMRWTKYTRNETRIVNGISTRVPVKAVHSGLVARRKQEARLFASYVPSNIRIG